MKNGDTKNGACPHFLMFCPQVENVLFHIKMAPAPFFQKKILNGREKI
jgi:hypothetical protein